MENFPQQRSKAVVPEYLQVFNSIAVLHLLEVYLSGYDPDSRVKIIDQMLGDWNKNIEERVTGELTSVVKNVTAENPEGNVNEKFWGVKTIEDVEKNYSVALNNGKATSFAILEQTTNSILTRLEKVDQQMQEKTNVG